MATKFCVIKIVKHGTYEAVRQLRSLDDRWDRGEIEVIAGGMRLMKAQEYAVRLNQWALRNQMRKPATGKAG